MTQYNPEPISMQQWIAKNEASFVPPVCNKLMYGSNVQTKVMFVGGPNVRKDYHIEEGEEIFLQLKGDMLLKIMEKGKPKDVPIKEGEIFVLPARIPHSPNRPNEGSIGLVIERERLESELDCVRWFVDDSNEKVLYERWFYCQDLGTQLGPVIKDYFASEAHKTRIPEPDIGEPKIKIDEETEVTPPFKFQDWLKQNEDKYNAAPLELFSGEFIVTIYGKEGQIKAEPNKEAFIWQIRGTSKVTCGGQSIAFETDSCNVVPAVDSFELRSDDSCVFLCQSRKENPFSKK
eukprot:TRINITY_DN6642_c0_g1_i1.p1 TRINITY_DN6642_c0_g1~~TRINITY_DN6642_c0_g1_i1.p1  ORF type:complete len:300 (+),score=80.83 TRINITY_DN6642_c0_g1_i1:33-902(+)